MKPKGTHLHLPIERHALRILILSVFLQYLDMTDRLLVQGFKIVDETCKLFPNLLYDNNRASGVG